MTSLPALKQLVRQHTQAIELRLPTDEVEKLMETLKAWKIKRSCTRRELESLIGLLSHACKVVSPGRRFFSALLELLPVAKKWHHHIRLNASFKADREWWLSFMEQWNGISMASQYLEYGRVRVFADLTVSIIRWCLSIICTVVPTGSYPGG